MRALLAAAALAGGLLASPSAAAEAPKVSTAAVTLGGRTVLLVRDRVLSLSAEERAERASDRLRAAARNPLAKVSAISVSEGEGTSDIVWGETVIMSVTERDAKTAGLPRPELARRNAGLLREAVAEYRRVYGVLAILLGLLLAGLLTFAAYHAARFLHAAYGRWAPVLETWARSHVPGLRLQSIELIPGARLAEALTTAAWAAYALAQVLLAYLYLTTVLSLFPWTRGYSVTILNYLLSPVQAVASAAVGYIPNVFFIAVICAAVHYAMKFLGMIAREVARERIVLPGFYPEWADPTFQILRFLAWAFALVVIFPYLPGSDAPAFKGVSVFLGVLVSLGSGSAVANAVAGVIMTYMRPFRLGERVQIGGTVGDVVDKSLLVTRLRTIKNVEVTIPNAQVLGGQIHNFSAAAEEPGVILHTEVTIGYDAPWRKVHELLHAAAGQVEGLLQKPSPFVLQKALGDFSVRYELNAYTDRPKDMAGLLSALHASIQDRFAEAGIEIMSPVFEVRRQGPASTVPRPGKPA